MSQEASASARPFVKSTYKHLSTALTAYWSGDRVAGGLIDAIHGSPRLTQWVKVAEGYRIFTPDEVVSVTVTPERIYTTKGLRVDDLQAGLPAQTLYSAIQTAQHIVQTNGSMETDEDFFEAGEDFSDGAGLDAALEDTHSAPLAEDDAELIDDVVSNPEPEEESLSIDPEPYDPERLYSQEVVAQPDSFTTQANRKNACTDGVICTYCGNLNKQAYRGPCPQCPKQAASEKAVPPESGKGMVSESFVTGRFKSLQGRILTIIDGSFSDKTQREAVKTLVNKEFRREISKVGGGE